MVAPEAGDPCLSVVSKVPQLENTPGQPKGPVIESLLPITVGIWGLLEASWGSRQVGFRVADLGLRFALGLG